MVYLKNILRKRHFLTFKFPRDLIEEQNYFYSFTRSVTKWYIVEAKFNFKFGYHLKKQIQAS